MSTRRNKRMEQGGHRQRQAQHTRDNEHQQRKPDRNSPTTLRKLEEWSNMEPDIIIVELIGQKFGFEALLESDLSGDSVVLVAKILAALCSSPFKENKTQIMNLISKDKFLYNLKSYVMQLQLQEKHERKQNVHFWNNMDGFFLNLIKIFETTIASLPTKACEILPKMLKAITLTIPRFETQQDVEISIEVKEKIEELQNKLNIRKSELERKTKTRERCPKDDFRQLSVYPTAQEILTNQRPFIRKHIIEGAYENVEHYLDVQFRLLKEDFVAPLREGVSEFLLQEQTKRWKISNVRIYKHVEFLRPEFWNGQLGVLLQFDLSKKGIKADSKRFMYGSLVCFTQDNFNTITFGKVIERDEYLEKGQVVIGFEPGYDNYALNKPYLMIECSVYFEPYYQVLKALQNIQEEDFPMKNYLIDVNPRIEPPGYLNPTSIYNIKNNKVSLFDPDSWPSAETLNLDASQHSAFNAALTEKFAVIQGPPGTGKTYLGLKIAKTLIRNAQNWYNQTPILVVCFTNHALDQFLEGLLGVTTEIVRIGKQSKSSILKEFHITEKRKLVRKKQEVGSALGNLRCELAYQLQTVQGLNGILADIENYDGVIDFQYFHDVDQDFDSSWFSSASKEAIIRWLLGGRTRGNEKTVKTTLKQEESKNKGFTNNFEEISKAEIREEHEIDEDKDLIKQINLTTIIKKPTYLITTSELASKIDEIDKEINKLSNGSNKKDHTNKKKDLEQALFETHDDLEYLKMRLEEGRNLRAVTRPTRINLKNPTHITANDRWRLYFYWLHQYSTSLINQLNKIKTDHRVTYKQYVEIKNIDDTETMKQMLVVGMTTTSAARLQPSLQALQSRIVIVEEAAEVLESHIIVSLTNHCEHLILIGDHKQLRPTTANFRMETHFNLGISLFERMVRNKIQCYVLGVQHRMRPEIAKLIVPSIYPILENHASVCNFPPVAGVDPCLYFIDHEHLEEETGDFSKLNNHEAEFLIRLARYLVQNGYQPEDITILAAYSGQMFALYQERTKYADSLEKLPIKVLDNYQGEESKIILLSLVRNNAENIIGFLKIENRVCVALSRAKQGFYIMGNMELLCHSSEIWPKIKTTLEEQEFLGKTLSLRCQVHREEVTRVKAAKDFDQVPQGGCTKPCEFDLKCGHKCTQICHMKDRAHKTFKCEDTCLRTICSENHQCPLLCYQECRPCLEPMERTLPCGHKHVLACHINPNSYRCKIPVMAKLPCQHTVEDKPCFAEIPTYSCPFPCKTRVEPCGHSCRWKCHVNEDPDHLEYKCHKRCARPRKDCSTGEHMCPKTCHEECPPCLVELQKSRTVCPHHYIVACNVNVDEVDCPKPCKKLLPCGHQCKKKCYEECDGCQHLVEKAIPECGHTVITKCCEEPNQKLCKGQCTKTLPCGHPCKRKCFELCTKECKELVNHEKKVDCGHKFKISCFMTTQDLPSNSTRLFQFCKEPCRVILKCSHPCSGTCYGCVQGRLHQVCKEKCAEILICGHECSLSCREACRPCTLKCANKCKHKSCNRKCGETCTFCKETCERRCEHVRCEAKCGDFCTVPPCSKPCQKLLPCGHPCVGFCGEPCPPLCKICNEDEGDAIYLLLDECKHVVESQEMESWLLGGGIKSKTCAKCKVPLASTLRYRNYIKQANKDVVVVKNQLFGVLKDNQKTRANLFKRFKELHGKCGIFFNFSSRMRLFLENFKLNLIPGRKIKTHPFNKVLLQTYLAKIEISEALIDIFTKAGLKNPHFIEKAIKYIDVIPNFLLHNEDQLTGQQIEDIERELKRFERLMQLYQIEELQLVDCNIKVLLQEFNNVVFSAKVYTEDMDGNLKNILIQLNKISKKQVVITEWEWKNIKVMGMNQNWLKCAQGHIYAQEGLSGCIECNNEGVQEIN